MYGIPNIWLIIRRDEDTCPPPQLYYERLAENNAFVRWDNNATHAACEFSFGPAGTAPEDGTIIPSTIPQHVFSGLDPDSHYVVYARARCDFARSEWTAWSAPLDIYLAGYGIQEAETSDGLLLAPNPATGKVTVTLPQGTHSLTVHSVDGREVYRNDTPAETLDIDVSRWARGVYTVGVESDRGTTARKLVVE